MCASGRTWSGLHAQQTFQPVTTAFATRKPSTLQVKLGVKSTCLLGNSMCVLFSMEPHIVELLLCFQPRMLWTSMSWPGPTNLISMLLLLIVNWNHTSRLADWQIGWRCAQINHHYLTVFLFLGRPLIHCVMVTPCCWCRQNPCSIWFGFVFPASRSHWLV